jgi:hypothetical protein
LDQDLKAWIVAHPGQSIINIIDEFSDKASGRTIRRKISAMVAAGLVSRRKELVIRPKEARPW